MTPVDALSLVLTILIGFLAIGYACWHWGFISAELKYQEQLRKYKEDFKLYQELSKQDFMNKMNLEKADANTKH